jgi:hypothetical protein
MGKTYSIIHVFFMNEIPKSSPDAELKERHPDWRLDTLIVGGYAPVKAVLIESDEQDIHELTPAQKAQWAEFKKDPLHGVEPDFRVLEDDFLRGLTRKQIDDRRIEWQHSGRFALNRYGRSQATAAGLALYLGFADSLILTGGSNKPGWVDKEDSLVPKRLSAVWPSEAELMRDIIIRQFGRRMFEKKYTKQTLSNDFSDFIRVASEEHHIQFDQYVEARYNAFVKNESPSRIHIEDKSQNMIEQIVYTANTFGDFRNYGVLFFGDRNNRDLDRFGLTAEIFLGQEGHWLSVSTNRLLSERAEVRKNQTHQDIIQQMIDPKRNPSIAGSLRSADRWYRSTVDPKYFWYWGGYLSLVAKASTMQHVFDFIHSQTLWELTIGEFINQALKEYYNTNSVPASDRTFYVDFINGTGDISALRKSVVPWYGRGSRREQHLAPELP